MAAKFKIKNLAFRRLGQNPILTADEDSENNRKADDIYDLLRQSMLRAHPWSFAKVEAELTALTGALGTPVLSDFIYIYKLPADFLRLNKTSVEPTYPHKIKGRYLYSNADAVSIEYGYDCKDPDAWVTGTTYAVGDYVLQNNTIYYCITAHTAGTFASDLAANWSEENIYDAAFTDAFATNLAYDLCMPITKDAKLKEVLGNELIKKLNYAKSMNGQEVSVDAPSQNQSWPTFR